MDACVCKNGVTGQAWCSFMRWPEVCLNPSNTGEHVAYIPVLILTLTGAFSRSSIPAESRCHFSCLLHLQLATVWVACCYRFDTISPRCLESAHTLASSKLACESVFVPVVCVWRIKGQRCKGERTGVKNPEGLVFFSDHFFPSVLYLLFSLPLLTLFCLSPVREELLFIWTSIVQIWEAVIFFYPWIFS